MIQFNFDPAHGNFLDLEKIASDSALSSVTTQLARDLIDHSPYMSIGDFLRSLSLQDLTILQKISQQAKDSQHADSIFEIMVLCDMLAQAEGVVADSAEQSCANCNFFISLVHVAVMARHGLAEVIWDRLSFDPAMANEVIVKFR